jgi:hypothetical protein
MPTTAAEMAGVKGMNPRLRAVRIVVVPKVIAVKGALVVPKPRPSVAMALVNPAKTPKAVAVIVVAHNAKNVRIIGAKSLRLAKFAEMASVARAKMPTTVVKIAVVLVVNPAVLAVAKATLRLSDVAMGSVAPAKIKAIVAKIVVVQAANPAKAEAAEAKDVRNTTVAKSVATAAEALNANFAGEPLRVASGEKAPSNAIAPLLCVRAGDAASVAPTKIADASAIRSKAAPMIAWVGRLNATAPAEKSARRSPTVSTSAQRDASIIAHPSAQNAVTMDAPSKNAPAIQPTIALIGKTSRPAPPANFVKSKMGFFLVLSRPAKNTPAPIPTTNAAKDRSSRSVNPMPKDAAAG